MGHGRRRTRETCLPAGARRFFGGATPGGRVRAAASPAFTDPAPSKRARARPQGLGADVRGSARRRAPGDLGMCVRRRAGSQAGPVGVGRGRAGAPAGPCKGRPKRGFESA